MTKLALIIISLDECLSTKGFSGGGHKVTKNLIQGLISSNLFQIDIFCKKSSIESLEGIDSINIIKDKKNFVKELEKEIKSRNYDYVLSSDILLPFANNLVHSHSSKYKSIAGKSWISKQILNIYNSQKIKAQAKSLIKNKRALFAVSEGLKKDYLESFNLDENKVFVCYPPSDDSVDIFPMQNEYFTIGSIAGGGLNKGGILLLLAMWGLPKNCKLKAKLIYPKMHKSFMFAQMIKLLGLQNRIELLPKQKNMQEYYQSIDCYVLPSLNEAFGLVVTEAASCSKPSLTSSTTGVRELIIDGENGFVFNRLGNPVRNLTKKLTEITELYFNDYGKYAEIAKNASQIPKKLDSKKFIDTIITNMIKESSVDKENVV